MELFNSILTWVMKKRIHQIELFLKYPHDVQEEIAKKLLSKAKFTEFGKAYAFDDISSLDQFKERVPVSNYEQMFPYIERLMKGDQGLLWPSEVRWFAKSSGTTNARSKFIPVTPEALEDCHFKGGKDMISLYVNNYPEAKIFTGKSLAIGGSHQINQADPDSKSFYGDVSAVIMANLPWWAEWARTPSLKIALMDEWESKIEQMAKITSAENVTCLQGVPTWTVVLFRKILELTGKQNITEVWPNLELFVHGAVSFRPYRDLFEELIPNPDMHYMDTYTASEGFFGIQDQSDAEDMLLMLDYGIYYEFIPPDEIGKEYPMTIGLDQVELNISYALVITTNAGLWRYQIGDTVKFTSLSPFRIKITGRTKHFINAFGEEVVIENAEIAIAKACHMTGAVVNDFTAAPRFFGQKDKGGHEWVIEFEKDPGDSKVFVQILDETLREVNSDYDAKRYKDIALEAPEIHQVPKGTFYNWMKKRGKLGGQHKVPRLSNSREYLDDILEMLEIAP